MYEYIWRYAYLDRAEVHRLLDHVKVVRALVFHGIHRVMERPRLSEPEFTFRDRLTIGWLKRVFPCQSRISPCTQRISRQNRPRLGSRSGRL